MRLDLSPSHGLILILILVSLFNLAGGIVAYLALPKIRAKLPLWELFAGYLMIILSLDMLIVHLVGWQITQLSPTPFVKGFLIGFGISFLAMTIFHRAAGHWGIVLFLLLAVHEVFEGMGIAEIFFETTVTTPILFALFPSLILAIHEFPEGLVLILPFFLNKKIKAGFGAVLINQIIFVVSGLLFYHYFLFQREFSLAEEALFTSIPAGGIFYLGLHDVLGILRQKHKLSFLYPNVAIVILVIITMTGTLASIYLSQHHLENQKKGVVTGFEIDPATGEKLPILSAPCQNQISLEDCLH